MVSQCIFELPTECTLTVETTQCMSIDNKAGVPPLIFTHLPPIQLSELLLGFIILLLHQVHRTGNINCMHTMYT